MTYDPEQHGARCSACPLRHQTPMAPKFASRGSAEPIVIVADSPSAMEVKTGKNIAGAAGVKLDEALYMAQLKQGDLFEVTYAILCRPEVPNAEGRKRFDLKNWLAWWRKENVARNRAAKAFAKQYPGTRLAESVRPLENPFSCCKPRLDAELARGEQYAASLGKQLVVMPMGSFALGVLHNKPGKSLGIMKYRGSVITDDQRLKESAT